MRVSCKWLFVNYPIILNNYGPSDINFFQGCLHGMFLVSKTARNGVKHGTDCRLLYSSVCPLWRLICEFKMCFEMNSVTGESCITAVKLMRAQSLTHTRTDTHSAPKITDGITKSPTAIPQENQHSCGRKKKKTFKRRCLVSDFGVWPDTRVCLERVQ